MSGSADFTVKVWALSAGTCLNTLTGHTEWVTKVGRLAKEISLTSGFVGDGMVHAALEVVGKP